jgi:hypothetical protein
MNFSKEVYFHIGYHKTGTTWLQQKFFTQHPGIINIGDSQNPWDDPFLGYLIGTSDRKFNRERCVELFKKQMPETVETGKIILVSAERLSGHPFSGGYDCIRIAERIKNCFPEAKIMCVVRNQVDVINSVYKQMIYEGYPGNLENFLFSRSWKGTSFTLECYEYDLLIDKYRSLFGEENVLAITYEEMKINFENFLRIICNFLNIEYINLGDQEKRVNRSLSKRGLSIIRFLNYFRKSELNNTPLFIIDRRVQKFTARILGLIPDKKNILSDAIRKQLIEYYHPSNEKLKKNIVGDMAKYL